MLGRPFLIALTVLVLAGCVAPAADLKASSAADVTALEASRVPPPDVDLSTAIVSDHGAPYMHALPNLHMGSYGMELVGYNPLTMPGAGDDPLVMNSGYAAITLFGHIACISHFAGSGGAGGATIVDFEDPADPVVLASIPDLKIGSRCIFTDDGKFLLAGSYGGALSGLPVGAIPAPEATVGQNGVTIYDVSDMKSPKFLAHDTTGAGDGTTALNSAYHNIGTALINGTNYVFQTYTGNILKLAEDGTSLEIVATVEHSDHDMWVGHHPITGKWTMITGANGGTAFYDITDPAAPVLQGVWEASEGYAGWHRQWPLAKPVDGKALVVVAGEECGNGKSLPYTVLDFTDPEAIKELGHWQIPGNPEIKEPGQLCSMNSHEFSEWNGYIASGNYHAGIWLFDVGTPARAAEPVTIGYYEPHENAQMNGGTRNTPFAWNPDVWGAYFDDRGYVIAADWMSGFYVLSFAGTPGAQPAEG
ncbi:MAG TPA: hypothetical protein VM370_02990 [Candidatus Thermoplasmatota archaeon]|nr:hypothetical protein [Candidatus Thermoplasmatota archaeon]